MKKAFIVFSVLALFLALPASINTNDFSADALKGLAWYFTGNPAAAWGDYEAQIKAMLEAQGIEWNRQRIEADPARQVQVKDIKEAMRDATPEQLAAIASIPGL